MCNKWENEQQEMWCAWHMKNHPKVIFTDDEQCTIYSENHPNDIYR